MKEPHILCASGDVAKYVILPGDPGRVLRVAEFLDKPREIAFNREYRTITGEYKGVPITVTSTGIGGPSANIAIEELVNCGGEYFIRIGSSGGVNSKVQLGDLVVATGAVREDGITKMYVEGEYPAIPDFSLVTKIVEVIEENKFDYHMGIVRSHDSFYIDNEEEVMAYWNKKNVIGSDMETSTLFTLGSLKGIRVASILNNVVEYKKDLKEGINSYVEDDRKTQEGERREILVALESLYRIEKNKSI